MNIRSRAYCRLCSWRCWNLVVSTTASPLDLSIINLLSLVTNASGSPLSWMANVWSSLASMTGIVSDKMPSLFLLRQCFPLARAVLVGCYLRQADCRLHLCILVLVYLLSYEYCLLYSGSHSLYLIKKKWSCLGQIQKKQKYINLASLADNYSYKTNIKPKPSNFPRN